MSNALNSNQGRVKALGALTDSIARRRAKINEHRKVIAERERLIAVAEKEINGKQSTYARIERELLDLLAHPEVTDEEVLGVPTRTLPEGTGSDTQIQVVSTEGSASPPVQPGRALMVGDSGYFRMVHPDLPDLIFMVHTPPEGNITVVVTHHRTQDGRHVSGRATNLSGFEGRRFVEIEAHDLPVWMLS